MRVVLYDDETMEPLTVLHLQSWMLPRLKSGERMVIPVIRKLETSIYRDDGDVPSTLPTDDRVVIWFERFVRNGERHWSAFTRDSENALSLRAVFLPGQWSAVHDEYERGVSDGIVKALGAMLR